MKIKIDRNTFLSALTDVAPFAPQKTAISILKYAKVTTKDSRMKIEANDTQCQCVRYIEIIECDQDGTFLIDINELCKFIAKVKSPVIGIDVNDSTVRVTYDKGTTDFQFMDAKDYPAFSVPQGEATDITLDTAMLAEAVTIAKNFVGTEELRPQMKPIYAFVKDGHFGYCATDTRAMVTDSNAVAGADGIDTHWYIEPMVFSAIVKACKSAGAIAIKVTPTHVAYRFGDTVLQTLQTKGNYPPFERVIPKTHTMECQIDRRELIDTLTRVALSASAASRMVKVAISPMDMVVSADNIDNMRRSSETLPHDGCNGEIAIGLHADLLTTCLGACVSDKVCLRLTDATHPVVFHQEDKPSMTILCMPMQINS